MSDQKKAHWETLAVSRQSDPSQHLEHSAPIYLNSGFSFEDADHMKALFESNQEGHIYTRISNPNTTDLSNKIALLEGAEAGLCFASGMAALSASFLGLLKQGDHIVSSRSIFGTTHTLFSEMLPSYGITTSFAEGCDPDVWKKKINQHTKAIFLETPANPCLDVYDIEKFSLLARSAGVLLIVDNTFATPYLQQPVKWGADLSIHSATKFIDGQGRVLGGLVAGNKDLLERINFFLRHTGGNMSPFTAWILEKSLETLAVRMDRHASNAFILANFLDEHSKIKKVIYPWRRDHPQHLVAQKQMLNGGGLFSFVMDGDWKDVGSFLNRLKFVTVAANLGDAQTIVTHPASTTHSRVSQDDRAAMGIEEGFIRVSVGLEHLDDLMEDFEQAMHF